MSGSRYVRIRAMGLGAARTIFSTRALWFAAALLTMPQAHADPFTYAVRYDRWSEDDERGYRDFIQAIGESACATVDECLHDKANPFRASDKPGIVYSSDC